jgi:hypothetical protein
MKRLALFICLLLLTTVVGAPKALRCYDWNGKRYTVVRFDDGTTAEIKGKVTDAESVFLTKATALASAVAVVVKEPVLLESCSLIELKAEIAKRGLTAKDLGLEVAKP